jgi:hypothetical protein
MGRVARGAGDSLALPAIATGSGLAAPGAAA